MQKRPSKAQRELMNFIGDFIATHGYGPSYREIMKGLGLKSVSTVAAHIDNLIVNGYVRKTDRSARSLELVGVSGKNFTMPAHTKESEEKWLVTLIHKKFEQVESNPTNNKKLDELYVLVGALHILGFKEPAARFKQKLKQLKT